MPFRRNPPGPVGGIGRGPNPAGEERARYEEAHRCAARFCRRLEERFLRRRTARPEAMVGELRAFYRLGRHAKLRHAELWR